MIAVLIFCACGSSAEDNLFDQESMKEFRGIARYSKYDELF